MYKCVLFDMDGTLVNTYQGIYNSYQYALNKMGLEFQGDQFVGKVIGAPLLSVFRDHFLLDENQAIIAVEHYREYYSEKGKNEVVLYEGIEETLIKLKDKGCNTGVATLKREKFAKEILDNLDLTKYFDAIYGIDEKDQLTKADLLEKCVLDLEVKKEETILVGDSEFDAQGADLAKVNFMAVTYGFGFRDDEELKRNRVHLIASTGYEIADLLHKN